MPGYLSRTPRACSGDDAPTVQAPRGQASRHRLLALLLSSVLAGTLPGPLHAGTAPPRIATPADARQQGLDSLHRAVRQDGGVPLPTNLQAFITDREAAVQLGKAFFWDMQVGSDGVQACASCHFHAGADNRATNALNPGQDMVVDARTDDVIGYFLAAPTPAPPRFETRPPNRTLRRHDFPFVKVLQELRRSPEGTQEPSASNSNDIGGSMGIVLTFFNGVRPGFRVDAGQPLVDPIFHLDGRANVRQVESKNTPTVINAVFNFTNFWNGSANAHFNGKNVFGDQDPNATILVNRPGQGLVAERLSLPNASLASQAMNPPRSPVEMSFGDVAQGNTRQHREIGLKPIFPPNPKR